MKTTIQTFTGLTFDLLNPDYRQVNPVDIAYSLAAIPRYNGHCTVHYSVAEHCVLLHDYFAFLPRGRPESFDALAALIHDAPEAYTGDMIRPLKNCFSPQFLAEWANVEKRIMNAIIKAICGDVIARMVDGRVYSLDVHAPHIKYADDRIVGDEQAAFMRNVERENDNPLEVEVRGWDRNRAAREWLIRLNHQRNMLGLVERN